MKKFLNSKFGETIVLIGASIVNLIFTIAYYSVKFTEFIANDEMVRGDTSFWNTEGLRVSNAMISYFNTLFIVLFGVGVFLYALSALLSLINNKKWTFYISVSYNLVLSLAVLFVNVFCGILRKGAVVCAVISVVMSVATLIFMIARRIRFDKRKVDGTAESLDKEVEIAPSVNPVKIKALKIGMIVCECLATLVYLSAFAFPLYTDAVQSDNPTTYYLINGLFNGSYPLYLSITSMVTTVMIFAGILVFTSAVSSFAKNERTFADKSQSYMYLATFLSFVFFAVGYGLTFYTNLQHSDDSSVYAATTISYIPVTVSVVLLIVFSVLQGLLPQTNAEANRINRKKFKIEPLIYVVIITAITFGALAINLITVELNYGTATVPLESNIKLSGYELLKNSHSLESGYQMMAFVLLAMLIVSAAMLIVSVVSYFAKYKDYYSILKTSAYINFVFALIIGLFGIYFQVVQKINEENILSLLEQYRDQSLGQFYYVSKVSTQSYFTTIASFVVLLIMIIRSHFMSFEQTVVEGADTVANDNRVADKADKEVASNLEEKAQTDQTDDALPASLHTDLDVCPAFTELDMKIGQFEADLIKRQQSLFTNFTLPNLVRFVVDYARECRLHLSYSLEDMATFVAGLGASRLTILQGMSGTGKTSLPKIFTEAIMGTCEIVEVESSWRDKNELLGYYNEFSKCYTPKKFTQCLYKARLNSSVPTFIVLDEMNLSRIEYYFSDFLSLMENEEDKREIKLLNTKLLRNVDGQTVEYRGLTDGHTIKIPANVWFIGTANRDESTFEISDKVYDRAQTMNFNKRAPKVHSFSEPLAQRFVTYDMIAKLFDDAKKQYEFDAEQNRIVQKVEKLLAPYNISFGNRILKQMEEFVKIYCTCFGDKSAVEDDAVEKILLSKVVSKLENKIVENKQALVAEFNKLGLNRCSAFIEKLNED
ncbi:MAG: hypothetical protein K2M64_03250 [Clostridia bacterium]|nr:hypothetical protein [Clostridia bacterium]